MLKFIYHYLTSNIETLINLSNGSTIKWLNKDKLKNIKIKVPLNKVLITNMNPLFEELELL